ncbi:MAG: hypothetical protein ACKOU7_14155 [Ferruginibacter sp.]
MKKLLLIAFIFVYSNGNAQIGMPDDAQYVAIKNQTLYVEMSDTTSTANKLMAKAIRQGWTVSKLEFITPQQMSKYLQPGNFFVTLEHDNTSFNYYRERTNGFGEIATSRSGDVNNDYFYLSLWTLDKNFEADKGLKPKNKRRIARAELYLKSIGTGNIDFSSSNIGSSGFQNEFCNGLPGYIKCIFQGISNNIANNKTVQLKKDIDASPALANLKKDTLYVPNYWIGPGGTMLPDEPENSANGRYIRKLLDSYSYPTRLIRRDELSNMILNATKPVYYFNYVQSSADKMISVVNGQTGEVLYYNFNDKSYRPKPKNFKELSDLVEAAN